MEITKEQVLELHNTLHNERVGYLLKLWFPKAFIDELTINKWYKADNILIYITKINEGKVYGYGFEAVNTQLRWWGSDDNDEWYLSNYREATHDEVSNDLIREAKKRGYKDGNYHCLSNSKTYYNISDKFTFEDDKLFHGTVLRNVVFADGEWAEIIETITKEEAEKLLNKRIIC